MKLNHKHAVVPNAHYTVPMGYGSIHTSVLECSPVSTLNELGPKNCKVKMNGELAEGAEKQLHTAVFIPGTCANNLWVLARYS